MKTSNILRAWALGMALAPMATLAGNVVVSVHNSGDTQRQELVEVSANDVYSRLGISQDSLFIVKNAFGQQVAYQLTYDGKLLIDASVRPGGTAHFTVEPGKPQPMTTYACGRQYPERLDDITWENDRAIYRAYGPALQRTGEKAYGIDVWMKNTPELEAEKRYDAEVSSRPKMAELRREGKTQELDELTQAISYHLDHGNGLDCYNVGPTLGCGTPALMDGDQMVMPYCYKTYQILDNGPLRFTVLLDYNPTAIGSDKQVVEHRLIRCDKGSNFCEMTVWYDGLTQPRDMVAGVVIHGDDTHSLVCANNSVLYADPTDNPDKHNFQIYVGVLFPNGVKALRKMMYDTPSNGNAGHGVGVITYHPGEKYTYYFGTAWSKYDVRTFAEWQLRAKETLDALHAPLEVTVR